LATVATEPGAGRCWDTSDCAQGAATIPQFRRLPLLPKLDPKYADDEVAIKRWNTQAAAYEKFTENQHALNEVEYKKENNIATPDDLSKESDLRNNQAKTQKEIEDNDKELRRYVLDD